MMFAALLFDPRPGWGLWAVALAFGLTQTGVILVNNAEDYPEDRHLGVRTAVVALGLSRGIGLAAALIAVGGVGLLAGFHAGFFRHLPPATGLGLVPLVVSVAAVGWSVTRLWWRVRGSPEAGAIAAVKRAAKWVPLWITSVALSSLAAAAVWYRYAPAR
jgi:1,4-dihydroxy-2-naphthoate octaprenyltransferase